MADAVPEEPDYFAYPGNTDENSDGRDRAFTEDSECSTTESRAGDYEMYDDSGKEIAVELNLRHPEVAYQFTEQKVAKSTPKNVPVVQPSPTGGTMKLRKLQEEIDSTRRKQDELIAQIEREKAEVRIKTEAVEKQERQLNALLQSKPATAEIRSLTHPITSAPAGVRSVPVSRVAAAASFQKASTPAEVQNSKRIRVSAATTTPTALPSAEVRSSHAVRVSAATPGTSSSAAVRSTPSARKPTKVESPTASAKTTSSLSASAPKAVTFATSTSVVTPINVTSSTSPPSSAPLAASNYATVSNTDQRSSYGVEYSVLKEPMNEDGGVPVSSVAREHARSGQFVGHVGQIDLIIPQQQEVEGFSPLKNIRKVIIGGDQDATDEDKVVLLFGSKGAGKTSVITSMLNYLYDVKKENPFRFTMSQEISQTLGLTEYVINNSILPFRVTVVDTPGVIDEKGYNGTSSLIRKWFEQELKAAGRFRMDAISLVLKNDEEELGWPYIHELAEVKRMFGDDLKTNVLPIITHSEVLPQPLAVRALAYANVTFLEYYKVNNSGFMPSEIAKNKLRQNLFYTHGTASLERYFTDLHNLVHPLLAVLHSSKTSESTPAVQRAD